MIFFADANGDLSGDEQSISSGHQEVNDENSMDSDRGGALNLVRHVFIERLNYFLICYVRHRKDDI